MTVGVSVPAGLGWWLVGGWQWWIVPRGTVWLLYQWVFDVEVAGDPADKGVCEEVDGAVGVFNFDDFGGGVRLRVFVDDTVQGGFQFRVVTVLDDHFHAVLGYEDESYVVEIGFGGFVGHGCAVGVSFLTSMITPASRAMLA